MSIRYIFAELASLIISWIIFLGWNKSCDLDGRVAMHSYVPGCYHGHHTGDLSFKLKVSL